MKKLFTICLLYFFCQSLSAQQRGNHDQINSLKIAHISSELSFTAKEAEKFWPLYTAYSEKMHVLRNNAMARYIRNTDMETIDKMQEKEAAEALKKMISYETEYLTVRSEYLGDLQKVLSAKKIIQLNKAEDDFNRKLLKQYRDKK
ncbi:hypothetical protein [Flavobacterium sp. JP2137]|uniref:hypothetical protein n=1 Tax=Flavobacterium sp. JP2137 TaxID=3414510 RepID=UPI003D3005E1